MTPSVQKLRSLFGDAEREIERGVVLAEVDDVIRVQGVMLDNLAGIAVDFEAKAKAAMDREAEERGKRVVAVLAREKMRGQRDTARLLAGVALAAFVVAMVLVMGRWA